MHPPLSRPRDPGNFPRMQQIGVFRSLISTRRRPVVSKAGVVAGLPPRLGRRRTDVGYSMQLSTTWTTIRPRILAVQVYRAVRARIMERSLRPGEFVREHEVSRALG